MGKVEGMSTPQNETPEEQVTVIGSDGQPVAVQAVEAREDEDTERNVTDLVEQPAKV
ncbi:MAG: hypothetical protein JWR64_2192, partial [Marmoricola sp.]|nr:hypothetical protein [Marmoricola sp.]